MWFLFNNQLVKMNWLSIWKRELDFWKNRNKCVYLKLTEDDTEVTGY
jgi:hypothetical protein